MTEPLYKVTAVDGSAFHGGSGRWMPNRWRTVKGVLEPCEKGLHLCRRDDLMHWLGPLIWEAEYEGERIDAEDKIVVRKARVTRRLDTWNERTARLFAADCAEHVLPAFEVKRPNDSRPRNAIETARRYARGEATERELSTARFTARSAAWSAAEAARYAAEAARYAAEYAARSAAW
ncbi:MAG: putative immunity protein, partial [Candidatus Limnocylindrales bacterium]